MVRRLAGRQRRSFIPTLLDGREIGPTTNDNYGDYSSRAVNQLIDKALAEQDPDRRAAIWGDADRQAMADAAWAPLLYERRTFFWSYRVKNWTYSPWIAAPTTPTSGSTRTPLDILPPQ